MAIIDFNGSIYGKIDLYPSNADKHHLSREHRSIINVYLFVMDKSYRLIAQIVTQFSAKNDRIKRTTLFRNRYKILFDNFVALAGFR